jgi:hypothetical protein
MRAIFLPVLAGLILQACTPVRPPDTELAVPEEVVPAPPSPPGSLEVLWIASGFEQPEGAALAPAGGYFISNIGPGEPGALDGNGYISRVNEDGSIANARFAEGLHAPAGLTVHDGILYAADRDGVAMIDAATGQARGKVMMQGVAFLNDMTVWKGDVLVSDSGTGTIHKVTPQGASVFAASGDWEGINGILGDGDRLLITTMTEGRLVAYRGPEEVSLVAAGMKDADGVGLIPGGGYLVSSWPGEIYHVGDDASVTLLIDTKADGILQNDLSVFSDVVIVPNWEPGTVTAWKITPP